MLKDSEDALGHQLYDVYRGQHVFEVVERDDDLIDPSETNPKYYLPEFKDWTRREKIASRYVKGRVLDIGCGGGRWSLYLQRKGHDVSEAIERKLRKNGEKHTIAGPKLSV